MENSVHSIVKKLCKLAVKDKELKVFGASSHRYEMNPVLSERELRKVEYKYSFTLPKDYRWFIMNVGNGGAGPYYGILPLGKNRKSRNMMQRS